MILTWNISSSLAFLLASLLCFITLKAMIVHQTRITRKGKSLGQTELVNTVSLYYWLDHISTYKSGKDSNITKYTTQCHRLKNHIYFNIIIFIILFSVDRILLIEDLTVHVTAFSQNLKQILINNDGTKSLSVNLNDSAVQWKL